MLSSEMNSEFVEYNADFPQIFVPCVCLLVISIECHAECIRFWMSYFLK